MLRKRVPAERVTLANRIFVALLAISVISASLATMASALLHQATIMSEAQTELSHECAVLASTLNAADDAVHELESVELGDMRATLVTPEGEVLYDSLVAPSELVGHGDRPEVEEALAVGSGFSLRASDTLGNVSLYQAQRLKSGNVLRLSVDRESVWAILIGDLRILGLILVGLVAVSWVTSRALAARLVKPILQIDTTLLAKEAPYEELQPLTDRLAEQQAELLSQVEDLRSADAIRREFTANVTHELKTPIASIMGASELMRDGFVLDEDIPGFASRINSEAQRLAALVNDILTLSRLDESERIHRQDAFGTPEAVDLFTIAHDAAERLAGRADLAEVNLVVAGSSTMITGFPRVLDEIIANLASNAIRYNTAGGEARIWVGTRMGHPVVEVSDTGIGIPEEAQAKVFERFYRVEPSRSRASGGTGLGLAIVKHAATFHGAEIDLQSAVGKGTTITVTFPVQAATGTGNARD